MKGLVRVYYRHMRIRGVDFGHVMNASGARGFFGEGYWFHRPWSRLGLDYSGSTFVAKTTTLRRREGNMPLGEDGTTPRERVPKCIVVKPLKGVVLNSVGLSGPGAEELVRRWGNGEVRQPTAPYFVSFMSVAASSAERVAEAEAFAETLRAGMGRMPGPFGLQLNLSCPNVGVDPSKLAAEADDTLEALRSLELPLAVKLNALVPPEVAARMSDHPACDAVVCSNTIPWGKLPDRIDWKGLFGSDGSPLAHLGGGGLSGAPLVPIVRDWIRELRSCGVSKPVVGGGGVLSADDAMELVRAGADAVELGSVSILRPWRVGGIVRYCNYVLGAGKETP